MSHEWKKSFVVPYSPRKKPTKLLRKSIEPPRIGLLDPDPLAEKDKERSRASSAAPTTSNNYIFHHRLRSEQRERRSYYKPKSQHVGRYSNVWAGTLKCTHVHDLNLGNY